MDYFIDAADSSLMKAQVNTARPKTEVVYKCDH